MRVNRVSVVFLTMSAAALLFVSSCKKDDPEPAVTPTPVPVVVTSTFTAKLDAVIFNETLFSGLESPGANTIIITASRNGGVESIGLAFSNTIVPGSYTYDGGFGEKRGLYNLSTNIDDMYSADSGTGTLVITSHDLSANVVVGTFSFVANPNLGSASVDDHAITEGAFTLQY